MRTKRGNLLTRLFVCMIISIIPALVDYHPTQAASPGQLPTNVGIGTHPVGGGYYACGTGIQS